MVHVWNRDHGLAALLLVFIGVLTWVQVAFTPALFPWAALTVLAELIASALLTLRLTFVVGAVNMCAAVAVYGFGLDGLRSTDRLIMILAVFLAFVISLLVCRIRVEREDRLMRVMISRDRLRLLSEAGRRIGSTLDVSRTAQELADVSVPPFADLARVDLLVANEPRAAPLAGTEVVRRTARQAVRAARWDLAPGPGPPMRYPESSGLARCLATGRSVLTHDVTETRTWFAEDPEHTGEAGAVEVDCAMAVPLRARGITLGVAIFGRLDPRTAYDGDDVLHAEEIVSRAAVCVDNARRYTHERATALALQRSLLPQEVPILMAVDTHSRYLPADSSAGVGGDWFDVIPLSGARVALVVGDVAGHGIRASAAMGRLRTAVRTLADIDLAPDELLTRLDDVVTHQAAGRGDDGGAETGISATCLYAVYDPVSCMCTLARAGHPPPAVRYPDGTVGLLEAPAGPPLGVGGLPFEVADVRLPPGSLLVLYTDGLIESRERDVDQGLSLLCAALNRTHMASRDVVMGDLTDRIIRSLIPGPPADDVALLMARTAALDAGQVASWQLPADPRAVSQARKYVSGQLVAWKLVGETEFSVELIVSELVTNAVRYASGPIALRLIRGDGLICEVSDGSNTSPHLRQASPLDEGGRGLFLIAQTSRRWGTRQTAVGKTIWAELDTP